MTKKTTVLDEVVTMTAEAGSDIDIALKEFQQEAKVSLLESALSVARNEVANSLVRGYGAMREYSILLNGAFGIDWFDIEHSNQSDEAKPVLAEKKAFYKVLNEANHTNPSVVWKRVCNFGKAERYGVTEKSEGENGEGENGEGEGETTSPARGAMLRNVEELTTLWKFNSKQENLDLKIVEAQKAIGLALQCLGVNVTMLG